MYPITTQIIVMLFVVHFALSRQVEFKKAESDPGFTAKERSNSKEVGHYVPKLGVRLQKTPASFLSVVPFDSVTLECEAEGNPSPTIYWLKNGRRIHQGTWEESGLSQEININEMVTRGVSRTRSRLYLDCVSAKDEGIFSCIAENPYQRVSGKTNLKLSEERETRNAICVAKKSFGTPARIHMWTRTRIETQGNDIQLFCRASGNPQPKINWIRGDDENKIIKNSEKYKILENGDLVIRNLSWGDLGGYTCVAKNVNGAAKTFTFVYPAMPEEK
ncbi:zwei Ig domain protein zig-4-like isoform X1 [Tachypleus tridentatus]|uniref:zwei Ig domain protein zig-4-like isoform X1 n=1 Tax=Tachypleus tridentatus TaxID=6853 RepID=UPI003FD5CF72